MTLLLITISALAVPLALSQAGHRTTILNTERERQLASLADAAATPGAPIGPLLDRYHQVYGEGVLIADADGRVLAASGLSITDPGVADLAAHTVSDAPTAQHRRVWPWDRQNILLAKGIHRDGELIAAVVLAVDPSATAGYLTEAWLWIGAGCIALLALTFIVAQGLTRWVLRPLAGLERSVEDITGGHAGQPALVAGPPELRRFTSAFNAMSSAVRASLEHQRRLIADASHQLRNPLAAVRLRADTLEDHVCEPGRQTYESMSDELDRLEHLLTQLLRLARAEEARQSHRTGLGDNLIDSADLDSVVLQRLAFWQPTADRSGQRLQYRPREEHVSVRLPRHDIEQLLDIALDNALRYSGAGSTVTVTVTRSTDGIEVTVSDDGPGLPATIISRATSRFWRGHTDSDGTGLGLAIATEIAASHGGSASVCSAPEGGLSVRYHLPAGDLR